MEAARGTSKPRVETREHAARKPAASCRGSLGGPAPAWIQPGPPGLARTREAPGGNPGTPGTKTTPPSMPDDGTQFPGSTPHRMAPGKACDPESPGFRRGLFVPFARFKLIARLGNAQHQKAQVIHLAQDSRCVMRKSRAERDCLHGLCSLGRPEDSQTSAQPRQRRGFSRSACLASCSGRLLPQSARVSPRWWGKPQTPSPAIEGWGATDGAGDAHGLHGPAGGRSTASVRKWAAQLMHGS